MTKITQPAKGQKQAVCEESAQPKQKDSKGYKFANFFGLRKDEPEVDDKEDNLGVVMFFGGI